MTHRVFEVSGSAAASVTARSKPAFAPGMPAQALIREVKPQNLVFTIYAGAGFACRKRKVKRELAMLALHAENR